MIADNSSRARRRLAPLIGRPGRRVHVALGSLVDAPSIRPTHHIVVGSKAPWFEIKDGLRRFDEHALA